MEIATNNSTSWKLGIDCTYIFWHPIKITSSCKTTEYKNSFCDVMRVYTQWSFSSVLTSYTMIIRHCVKGDGVDLKEASIYVCVLYRIMHKDSFVAQILTV
ncbi:hypothetical protein HZS_1106 [Henneguya salminicola]|nr:hypothetical protein HZS_1106 [Henneguya salminicola]